VEERAHLAARFHCGTMCGSVEHSSVETALVFIDVFTRVFLAMFLGIMRDRMTATQVYLCLIR
jgi:hypothetical protein